LSDEVVLFATEGPVATITLNRPARRNAVDQRTRAALRAAVARLEDDPELRAGILTGAGDAAFCAGADLHEMKSGIGNRLGAAGGGFAGFVRTPRTKPIVAAVNGPALGGGFELVLACELVVSAEHATFSLPEVLRGIMAGGGGAIRLPERLPVALANEILLTGAPLTAADALRWGLANRVVPSAGLMPAALELARAACRGAPVAVASTLAVSALARRAQESASWEASDLAVERVRLTQDAREGPAAFAERREPRWSGR
jgi:enoyl-CoA hydratase/carnithine racemase